MILVTGGTGLVGSHLLYHLALENNNIRAIYRENSNLKAVEHVFSYYTKDFKQLFDKIEWVKADIIDVPSLHSVFTDVRIVYHCAAIVSFDKKEYRAMRKVNMEGTANMVNFSLSNNIEKFCFVSSIATLEKSIDNKIIDESNEWNSETNNYGYAITKYGAEMEVWRASQEGLEVVIVNPGVILGAGFWQSGPGELFAKFYNEFKFFTNGMTGFVAVKDVVKAMIQLTNSNIINERFILVAENRSFKEVFFKMADSYNKKRPTIKVTKFLSSIAWRLEWFKSFLTGKTPLITKHSASASLSSYQYSSNKIKETINFVFEPLNKTITDVCKNFVKDKHSQKK